MLEMTREIDFAVYGAGAVGSMSPRTKSAEGEKRVKEISYGLFEKIYEGFRIMGAKYETKLISKKIDIELREESFRVTKILSSDHGSLNFLSERVQNIYQYYG